jgi:probable F420-dependent oxidoreductase
VRFGLTTPIVTLVPRSHSTWEAEGGPRELAEIARAADRLGFSHLTCSEHVAIPEPVAQVRGGRYYDPPAPLGYLAGMTERIRLVTHVIVLPYHHPLMVAKRYGTLDRLSGGRVILGVGVGSLKEEFDLLEVDFAGRGPRYEDALRALRAALGKHQPEYRGTHYSFAGFIVDPCAVQSHMPIWIGGRSPRSLRRALELAEGWDPFGLDNQQLGELLQRARSWPQWQRREEPFDVVLSPERPLAPTGRGDVARIADSMATLQRIGATAVNLRFKSDSLSHYLELLDLFAREVMPAFA